MGSVWEGGEGHVAYRGKANLWETNGANVSTRTQNSKVFFGHLLVNNTYL